MISANLKENIFQYQKLDFELKAILIKVVIFNI